MSIQETFQLAKSEGEVLLDRESSVIRIDTLNEQTRTWIGYESSGNAVAYFEVDKHIPTPYSVSQVITVESLQTVNPDDAETITALKVICHDKGLERVFQSFIEEVLRKQPKINEISNTLSVAASEWRSLLQLAKQELSESQALGLYGELMFLEELIKKVGPNGIEFWQQSTRDVHDFVAPKIRVEIKTSSFQNKMAVTIHGLKQLTLPVRASLILSVADIQKHGDGDTIASTINRIHSLDIDRTKFHQKLHDAGIVAGMNALEDHKFTLLNWRFWWIDKSSPVLSTSRLHEDVRDAISDVSYSLNLDALGQPLTHFPWEYFQDV